MVVVIALFWAIAIGTAWRSGMQGAPMPDPFVWANWTAKETLVPLLCFSFAAMQLPPGFGTDPGLMARRLFDVAMCVAVVLGLDFVATHAQFFRDLFGGTPKQD